ncbi:hypothetical protein SDC9_141511 [bioreactor metagenome]|uniref:Uncharacterized protein n=1 Tax=bioreactor metagenome TaxID=1076179 RepID=A0A645DYH3_9ZZZZ
MIRREAGQIDRRSRFDCRYRKIRRLIAAIGNERLRGTEIDLTRRKRRSGHKPGDVPFCFQPDALQRFSRQWEATDIENSSALRIDESGLCVLKPGRSVRQGGKFDSGTDGYGVRFPRRAFEQNFTDNRPLPQRVPIAAVQQIEIPGIPRLFRNLQPEFGKRTVVKRTLKEQHRAAAAFFRHGRLKCHTGEIPAERTEFRHIFARVPSILEFFAGVPAQ